MEESNMVSMAGVQTIDLTVPPTAEHNLTLKHVLQNHGCCYVKYSDDFNQAFSDGICASKALFEGDNHVKQAIGCLNSPCFVGYKKSEKKSYETFDMATEFPEPKAITQPSDQLRGPNLWPSHLPTLPETFRSYEAACESVSRQILARVEHVLELPSLFQLYQDVPPQYRTRFVRYPSLNDPSLSVQSGFQPHTDEAEWLTLIAQNAQTDGLEVYVDGRWVTVPAKQGHVFCLFGDPLHQLIPSVVAGYHKVVLSPTVPRNSIAFFMTCPLQFSVADMRRIIGCPTPDNESQEERELAQSTFTDRVLAMYQNSFPDVFQKFWLDSSS